MQDKFFVNVSDVPPSRVDPDFWSPVVISKEQIDAEIERLADQDPSDSGRRESMIVHPNSSEPGLGLAPGIRVTLCVLRPGERTVPLRQNSSQVNFCIQGSGYSLVDDQRINFKKFDTWNFPGFSTYQHVNDSDELQVRLTYSNAPLLEKMNVHYVEENAEFPVFETSALTRSGNVVDIAEADTSKRGFQINDTGAYLMPYEELINPPPLVSRSLHWPWKQVRSELDRLEKQLGKDYVGRRLYLMYNPLTGRTNGTTPNFFATITIRPAQIIDRPHRHTSAAINYYFAGRGYSVVEGKRLDWKAGDIMLSAPGWAIHNHASRDQTVYELTIQDQPLNIAMESLLWQEDLKGPIRLLGKEAGFETNRKMVVK